MGSSYLDDTIRHAYGPLLEPHGFSMTRPRKWVRDKKVPIREVFQIYTLKSGMVFSPRWGFGVDFVPLFWSRKPRWHRTNKSCELDLIIDPRDLGGDPSDWHSFSHSPRHAAITLPQLRAVAYRTVPFVLQDFSRVSSLHDLEALYAEREKLPYRRFSLDNYVQSYISWALVCCALGREERCGELLDRFCARHNVDKKHPMLLKALEQARAFREPPKP